MTMREQEQTQRDEDEADLEELSRLLQRHDSGSVDILRRGSGGWWEPSSVAGVIEPSTARALTALLRRMESR